MKSLHKRIIAVLLAIMVISVGYLSSANAISFSGYRGVYSVNDFIKNNGFKIYLKEAKEQDINIKIDSIVANYNIQPQAKKRLLKLSDQEAKEVKSIEDIKKLLNSGRQLYKIKVEKWYYLVSMDDVSFYAAQRKPEHKYPNKKNQRNYDIIDFYKQRYKYDIIDVKDMSSAPLRVEMNALIQRNFKNKPGLKVSSKKFENAESLRISLKSGNKFFENLKKGEYHRISVENLDYIIFKN